MYAIGSGSAATKTVLAVEDDGDVLEEFALALERAGYRVVTTCNGREALDWLARQPVLPSIILLDWMMPVLDGLGFLSQQASDPRFAAIPVVVVSAVARMAAIPRLCVAAVVAKPVRLRTLVEIVDRLCGVPPRGSGGEPTWERSVGKRAPTDPGSTACDDATTWQSAPPTR